MAEHLGCQTFVVTPDSAGVADEPCGHLLGQHRDPDGGPCQIAGCGCPTYTPPASTAGTYPGPYLDGPVGPAGTILGGQ